MYFCSLIIIEMEKPIKIDIRKVIMNKAPKYGRFIPGFVYRKLARIIRQNELNKIMSDNAGKHGCDFAEGTLQTLGVKVTVHGMENIPTSGRFVFASNHPLGGLDGIALLATLGKRFDGNVKCIANDLLMAIAPLRNVFLPINKHGAQSRESARAIDAAYASDCQMIMFPAGLCSRRNDKGEIRDLEWQKSFITKSIESQRDIIPVFFDGLNSKFFYKFAEIRRKIGLKLNIEMVRLPAEMVNGAGKTLNIYIGKPISYSSLDNSKTPKEWASEIRNRVYSMAEDK